MRQELIIFLYRGTENKGLYFAKNFFGGNFRHSIYLFYSESDLKTAMASGMNFKKASCNPHENRIKDYQKYFFLDLKLSLLLFLS